MFASVGKAAAMLIRPRLYRHVLWSLLLTRFSSSCCSPASKYGLAHLPPLGSIWVNRFLEVTAPLRSCPGGILPRRAGRGHRRLALPGPDRGQGRCAFLSERSDGSGNAGGDAASARRSVSSALSLLHQCGAAAGRCRRAGHVGDRDDPRQWLASGPRILRAGVAAASFPPAKRRACAAKYSGTDFSRGAPDLDSAPSFRSSI